MDCTSFKIQDILIESENNPIGIDVATPIISWKLISDLRGTEQSSYQILVGSRKEGKDMWDSGKKVSSCSIGTIYNGKELMPCTKYYLTIKVWSQEDEMASNSDAWFETGFLNPSIDAWDGAKWIGAPDYYVRSDTRGVFSIETYITLAKGCKRAGIVFGANDKRLMDSNKNIYNLEGENYIRYEIVLERIPATLNIYRVGYHKDDKREIPFASVPIVNYKGIDKIPIITEENKNQPHKLEIEVTGNCAFTYIDNVLVDAEEREGFFGKNTEARRLNPLGNNDTITFPRLCEIGYYVGAGDKVHFSGLLVKNIRTPGEVFVSMDVGNGGIRLEGLDQMNIPKEIQIVKDPSKHSLPMLRRNFKVETKKEVSKARLYVTARGIYDCRINGKPISDQWFAPGCSQFDKHIMYQTYDISSFIKKGENGIGFTLASGWWCDSQTFVLKNYNYFGDKESLLAKIVISYTDGTESIYASNEEEWEYFGEGPYLYASFFHGEHYDARKSYLYEQFSNPKFYDDKLGRPKIIPSIRIDKYYSMPKEFARSWPAVNKTEPEISGGINAPVLEVERLVAKSMSEPRKGVFIYDFEQEIAGVPILQLKGNAGTVVTIRYGEMLYPDMSEYEQLRGMLMVENLRDASSTDIYILNGNEKGEEYIPKFTFHGYRYLEITGIPEALPLENVQSIQLSSVKVTGRIKCSNPLVNRFTENVKWSQLSNFISIPTDCPQRNERMGWAGDTHVFCRTATYQSDARLFYSRYLQAFRDLQENGQYPSIAPFGGGFGGITYECAMVFIVWELYQQYGDFRVIHEYYPSMMEWMDYLKKIGMPGLIFVGPLGDWLAIEETDNYLIWNAFYGYCAELMGKMAKIIHKEKDADSFTELEKEIKAYWNETFVDKDTNMTCDSEGIIVDTQCSYALPLSFHIFSEENKKEAIEHLVRKIKEADYTITTGFFGTGALNTVLSENGYGDIAYRLLTGTKYPSWLYPVTQGATTVWERWNSFTMEKGFGGNNNMNSFNHYSLGSVVSWMYETILGIRRDEDNPGYGHFKLIPFIYGFEYAEGGIDSPHGRIESKWKIKNNEVFYQCKIPGNTSAELILEEYPKGNPKVFHLKSGSYSFKINRSVVVRID